MNLKLKKSEKILLAILVGAILVSTFIFMIVPKVTELKRLNMEIIGLKTDISKIEQAKIQEDKIDGNIDNSISAEERELDNILLKYKNDFYIENYSQDYIILKLNDFLGNQSANIDGFLIESISFQRNLNLEQMFSKNSIATNIPGINVQVIPNEATQADDNTIDDTKFIDIEGVEDLENIENLEDIYMTNTNTTTPDNSKVNNTDEFEFFAVSLSYTSDYEGLVEYIKNIERFSKSIVVTSVNMTPVIPTPTVTTKGQLDETSSSGFSYVDSYGYLYPVPDSAFIDKGTITGTIQLIFIDLKIYDQEILEYRNPIFDDYTELGVVENPFKPYSNFTKYQREPENDNNNNNGYYDNSNSNGNNIPSIPTFTYKTIYDFEDNNYFFASSPTTVLGSAQTSPLAYSGSYSGKLAYTFSKGVETNTVSYVFNSNSILINEQPSFVSLKAYELSSVPYDLGITIKDSTGKTYDVALNNTGEIGLWSTFTGSLPELNYPCIVKRVFITSAGAEKTQLSGEILLDKLEIANTAK